MTPARKPHPDDLFLITREELDRCCSQMSAAGYKVSANYIEALVLSRPYTPAAPAADITTETCRTCSFMDVCSQEASASCERAIIEQINQDTRKAAREQVLTELRVKIEEMGFPLCFEKTEFDDGRACAYGFFVRAIESLRGGGA